MGEALTKFDFLKYFSRSFLLPLIGMVFTFLMAFYRQMEGTQLLYFGGLMAGFTGVFSLQDAFKYWVDGNGKKGGQ